MPWQEYWFELATMAALVGASAFFSGSEAALFSITRSERAAMAKGGKRDQRAATLLRRPERLLTAILFWNLVVNLVYYALTEVVAMRLGRAEGVSPWAPTLFTTGALATVILLSEVLPKSLAVLHPRRLSGLVARPLGAAARAIDPALPALQSASNAAARLFLPQFEPEPYMELSDLERAVQIRSGETVDNEDLLIQERLVLQRLVDLADATAVELMRPRRRCLVLNPPVRIDDLVGQTHGVGEYVLVTEPDSGELVSAIAISLLALTPPDRLEVRAERMVVVPWCASGATVLEQLREKGRRVAVVVNELGETIGVLTLERLLDSVLRDGGRADPNDAHSARLVAAGADAWEATGETPLRRVAKRLLPWLAERDSGLTVPFQEQLADARSRTVAGLFQERLERLPNAGDRLEVGGLVWRVISGGAEDGDRPVMVRIELPGRAGAQPGEGESR